jgi:hypothetical protein
MMGWLSGHEPQLGMMMDTYKCLDGKALGSEKVGEVSGEGGEKIGDILAPPKTYHKNTFASKPTLLRNKLDTNPDPPIFPHTTNDFQKPIKFKSDLGNVFFGKEGEKPSEEKLVEKPSGEKPNELPHLKDRLGDQRGGSEWEPIKILLQRENLAYVPNSQPRIPTRVCQSRVVTTNQPTLRANSKQSQSEIETQRAKDLAAQH